MNDEVIKIAMIGLDTSHCIEFARRIQAPDCIPDQKVKGMLVKSCFRFPSAFYDEKGQDERQRQLESWGVDVTKDIVRALSGADAIMMEINDPALHLEYFIKCSEAGKPIFIDKPLADNIENGLEIYKSAKEKSLRVFSSSSLRFVPDIEQALADIPEPVCASTFGPLGKAPKGSSIIWYGVHAFEMLQKTMGIGAMSVYTVKDDAGAVCVVNYQEGRRGVVELTEGLYAYGGSIRGKNKSVTYVADTKKLYSKQLETIFHFFKGAEIGVDFIETLEVMNMLDAAERSYNSCKTEYLRKDGIY